MNTFLRAFILQYLGVVLTTLLPVLLIAFMAIPVSLGAHPDDAFAANEVHAPLSQHMT